MYPRTIRSANFVANNLAMQGKRNQSNRPDLMSAGRQNKKPTVYKAGVQHIDGIPYTREEQNRELSAEEIRQTILTLCRDQRRNPNLSLFERQKQIFQSWFLPEANRLISESLFESEYIHS